MQHVPISRLLAGLFLALAACAPAVAEPTVPAGEYVYVENGTAHGEMSVAGAKFSIATTGGNCHECSVDGRFSGMHGIVDDGVSSCRFDASVGGPSVRLEIPAAQQDGCRAFCGARAVFEGEYRKPPAACTKAARSSRLEEARRAYRARDYATARAGLRGLVAECATFTDWIELDRERNDLALAELHAGDPAQCLKVLADTTAAGAKNEDDLGLPPCDKDNYLSTAKSTWHNRSVCQAAIKR